MAKFIKIHKLIDIDFIKNDYDAIIRTPDNISIKTQMEQLLSGNDFSKNNLVIISDTDVQLPVTSGLEQNIMLISDKEFDSIGDNMLTFSGADISVVKDKNSTSYYNILKNKEKTESFLNKYYENNGSNMKFHVIIDSSSIFSKYMGNILNIIKPIKEHINILEFINVTSKKYKNNIKSIIVDLIDIVERKINIFNEESNILIYRPVHQEDDYDVGWYILRGVSRDIKDTLLEKLCKKKYLTMTVGEDEVFITKTTVNYQNNYTYYDENVKIQDYILFPSEKMDMVFELLN